MLRQNTVLNNFERVCLYESAKGTNPIVDLYYNMSDRLHKFINLSAQYITISFDAAHLQDEDLLETYGIDIKATDIQQIYGAGTTGHEMCVQLILYIIANFPKISQIMLQKFDAYDNLQENKTFNMLPVITFNLN